MFSCGMSNLKGDNSSVKELHTTLSVSFFPQVRWEFSPEQH